MRRQRIAATTTLALLLYGSCTPLESKNDVLAVAGGGSASSQAGTQASLAGATSEGGSEATAGQPPASEGGEAGAAGARASASCNDEDERPSEVVAETGELTLSADTTWTCQRDYHLRGNVIVAPGATLTIDAGSRLRFDPDTLLLVQRGGSIQARGTAQAPITLTSSKPAGKRAPGDYRGLILIGNGPSQSSTLPVHDSLPDARAHYGGGQAGDKDGSCGVLRYVRIEFAGGSIDDPTLPAGALTLAGCGAKTEVEYVQVHRATDGIGLLGGTAPLRHVLVTNNLLGEAIEWSAGYTGTMQFIVAQSLGASAALQGSNSADDVEASPVSRPTIFNATLVGSAPLVSGQHFGLLLQFGSRVMLKNSVIQGFADAAFDLRLDEHVLQSQVGPGRSLDISHALLHHNAKSYSEAASVLAGMDSMRTQDPGLPAAANPTPEMANALPLFAPADPTVNTQPAPVPMGFDSTAGFRGGVPQDGLDWTLDWTSYPTD